MSEVIICCKCGDTPRFSGDAYHLLFKKDTIPPVLSKERDINKFIDEHQKGNVAKYAKALTKGKEKYSVYFEYDEESNVVKSYNLLTGRRISL